MASSPARLLAQQSPLLLSRFGVTQLTQLGSIAQSYPLFNGVEEANERVQTWGRHAQAKLLNSKPPFAGLGLTMLQKRWASSSTPNGVPDPMKMGTVQELLQQVQVLKLRDELDAEAERHLFIPYNEFVDKAKASGAAHTDDSAAELCSALQKSGILLRHDNLVYLRAQEIIEMTMLLLPGGKAEAQEKLARIEDELKDLEQTHQLAHRRGRTVANILLGTGLIILTVQFFAFIYLTWWELSWDVMEPFGYVISLFYSLVAYIYFMATRGRVFDLEPFHEYWTDRIAKKKIEEVRFDEDRYAYLTKLRDRYRRHIAHTFIRGVTRTG